MTLRKILNINFQEARTQIIKKVEISYKLHMTV